MELLFDNNLSQKPLVSIILLDWDCRESFHIFNYLEEQTVPREQYEIIWIEYYNRRPAEIEKMLKEGEQAGKLPVVDKWIVMEMTDDLYYHKHLMYNIGIVASKGEIITICDSDGIVKPSFVESIIKSFEEDSDIVLHMDEVRNKDRRFYPFNYPSIDEIIGDGCINYKDGKTTGLVDTKDIIHTRNYGSCMCALRDDLIKIGGADEHIDYLGHVCGPYEMTYRLVNAGKKEVWHQEEFLYHVWHPGTDGDDNYIGPHDGFNMSTTALEVCQNGRVLPIVENEVIKSMRTNQCDTFDIFQTINPAYIQEWTHEAMDKSLKFEKLFHYELVGSYKGYNILKGHKLFYAIPQSLGPWDLTKEEQRNHPMILSAETQKELEKKMDNSNDKINVKDQLQPAAEKITSLKVLFDSNLSQKPLVSIILLDWNCRESFHIFNYLQNQTVPREQYEIIWIEYYNRRPAEIEKMLTEGEQAGKLPIVDKWIVMEMTDDLYYHKHLMYNIGIVAGKGEIITICDSDGIVNPGFVESIIKSFEEDRNIVLHMDEVRNKDRRFYPFNYPSIEEIIGDGCINYKDGKTTGLLDTKDIIHTRNYGSCMCALREDLIKIGGADEHIDYLGHVCGPYEMTYRLVNTGKKEVWHQKEFLYHVWHPGTDGDDNYIGPHDGFNMSTTALEVCQNGRVLPIVENEVIKSMRTNQCDTIEIFQTINPAYIQEWTHEAIDKNLKFKKLYHYEFVGSYKCYNFLKGHKLFYAIPQSLGPWDLTNEKQRNHPMVLSAETQEGLEKKVDQFPPQVLDDYLFERNKNTCFVRKVAEKLVFWLHMRYNANQLSIANINKGNSVSDLNHQSIGNRFLIKLALLFKSNRYTRRLALRVKWLLSICYRKLLLKKGRCFFCGQTHGS